MKPNMELIKSSFEERRKIPKELKDVIDKTSFYNALISIAIMVLVLAINLAFKFLDSETFSFNMKILAMLILGLTIIMFEYAYKRDSGTLAITGIEMMMLGFVVLYMPFAYSYESQTIKVFLMIASVFFAIYYFGKLIVFYLYIKRKHINSLSDVKEITKKVDNGYLNDVSKKIYKKGE